MDTLTDYKIAIVGPQEMVAGFRALGVEMFTARTGQEALDQIRQIKAVTLDESIMTVYAVVCIIEDLMRDMDNEEYTRVASGPLPAVVILPGAQGTQGFAEMRLRRLAEKAIGSAIF